ncbi:MAG: adenylate/guanylate cyclase domain-containing protein [Caldilineaceae bacterium]
MQEISDLQHAIETLEAQRALLGDTVVNAALAPMRDRLRELQTQTATEQRRLVTILFADLVDFTVLTRRLDAEDVREVVNEYFSRWTSAIERHGGVVEKFAGDAVMAVFGLLQSTDLDPIQAVRAALAMGRELDLLNARLEPRFGIRLQMRTGIHTGHTIVSTLRERRGQDFVIVGDSVNLASRLQALAPVNGIVVSHDTYHHVSRQFELNAHAPTYVKGFEQLITYYTVVSERSHVALAPDSASTLAPLVGRDDVVAALDAAWHRMLEQQRGSMIAIVSEPGLGKSRILLEFERHLRSQSMPMYLLVGRSLPSLRGVPYGLLRDLFGQQLSIQDSDEPEVVERKLQTAFLPMLPDQPDAPALVGRLLGFTGGSGSPDQVEDPEVLQNRALARLGAYYRALAADRPVVALIEDLHWVDDSSLDLLDRLNTTLDDRRILIVATARPELTGRRPQWSDGSTSIEWIELDQLSAADCGRLLRELLKPMDTVPQRLVNQITAAADGNPYFVEELVKVLIEDGAIDATVQPWMVNETRLAQVRLPQTLTGVLQARLDGLQGEARVTLQRAAVIGRVFWDQAVVYLQTNTAGAPTANIKQALAGLNDRELVFTRSVSSFERAQEFLFKHALMRDVAYGSVLKRNRRIYHRLAAQWLEEMTLRSRRSAEFAALIAGHYDSAEDAEPAAHWYLQAGRQAARTFANAEALRALDRARELLQDAAPGQRYAVLAERERVFDLLGRRDEQGADLAEMERLSVQLDSQAAEAETLLRRSQFALAQGEYSESVAAAERAADLARAMGSAQVEAAALLQLGQVSLRQGEFALSLHQMQAARALAQQAGDRSLQADALHGQAMAQVFLGELDAAQPSFEAALAEAIAAGNRRLECVLLNRLSWVPTSRNDFLLAARYSEQALALSREIGDRMTEANALLNLGNAYTQLADFVRGDAYSQQALELYRQLNDPGGEGAVLDNLGNGAWGSGYYVKALQYKQEALEIIRRIGDRQTETNILGNLGIVAADMGDTAAALRYLLQALDLTRADGNRAIEGTIETHLALVHLQAGDPAAALPHAEAAHTIAQELDAPRDQINALNAWGSALLAGGSPHEALAIYRQEEVMARAAELPDYAAAAIAHQANALLALDDLPGAMERVEVVLATLHQFEGGTIYFAPADIFLACSRVLLQAGDPRAPVILGKAHAWLEEHMARFEDDALRRQFIENIPTHAALMRAWQEKQTSIV